jgi:hypothetical protein
MQYHVSMHNIATALRPTIMTISNYLAILCLYRPPSARQWWASQIGTVTCQDEKLFLTTEINTNIVKITCFSTYYLYRKICKIPHHLLIRVADPDLLCRIDPGIWDGIWIQRSQTGSGYGSWP